MYKSIPVELFRVVYRCLPIKVRVTPLNIMPASIVTNGGVANHCYYLRSDTGEIHRIGSTLAFIHISANQETCPWRNLKVDYI